ncbi:MAG: Rrf2 family transcriptional regulator [Epsilonproteobacteria bacterium]|jgi:Rrf2 family protein|uniref:Rrf2 family transcriptional regulator n=1 Tax=Sulfurospirillum cavolei TaxID=366522 RepID=A0A2D3W6F6_9BACT|nr:MULTISPECIES: Rrf2 family transcriptional regulator [Sulfurospirillum]NCB55491.1 Rrf2 family transcriptional regulator [Campylobacterota bacterium]KHG34241.1 MAG: Rrf2 family transcriptional regulator [Sulfurospirillum sp. MES]MCD8544131.1 Rrf2 family transcriptional regulator [Sulfurospirillum cavolei]MCP3651052.1 Rrf2 family transcriptional regulator [Sulfurospirillum sp. DNRA8]MCR1809898.1 Rrf2 family transcriptional regulator [Sulfurospirillum sp. DNRA8]
MSLLSTKGMYGLNAMYQLFLAKSEKPMQIKEISHRAHIPQNYLEQLLILLRQAGLVTSVRGAYGGYLLAKNAQDILIKDILIALEGKITVVDSEIKDPVLQLFYEESNAKIQEIFTIPLSDFSIYIERFNAQLNYSI